LLKDVILALTAAEEVICGHINCLVKMLCCRVRWQHLCSGRENDLCKWWAMLL